MIDKPSGLVVHPGAGNTKNGLVNQLVGYTTNLSSIGGESRLGIVHRLDKETSGLMIVAKQIKHMQLALAMQRREMVKKYVAITWGCIKKASGTIDINIGRSRECYKKMFPFIDSSKGKKAVTHYTLLNTYYNNLFSKVECTLATGRTHQIRVHLNHIKHPIVGDVLYGNNAKKVARYSEGRVQEYLNRFNRHALHSSYLEFSHPITNKILSFTSVLPLAMQGLLELLEEK